MRRWATLDAAVLDDILTATLAQRGIPLGAIAGARLVAFVCGTRSPGEATLGLFSERSPSVAIALGAQAVESVADAVHLTGVATVLRAIRCLVLVFRYLAVLTAQSQDFPASPAANIDKTRVRGALAVAYVLGTAATSAHAVMEFAVFLPIIRTVGARLTAPAVTTGNAAVSHVLRLVAQLWTSFISASTRTRHARASITAAAAAVAEHPMNCQIRGDICAWCGLPPTNRQVASPCGHSACYVCIHVAMLHSHVVRCPQCSTFVSAATLLPKND